MNSRNDLEKLAPLLLGAALGSAALVEKSRGIKRTPTEPSRRLKQQRQQRNNKHRMAKKARKRNR